MSTGDLPWRAALPPPLPRARAPVTASQPRLVGLIALDDVLRAFADDLLALAQTASGQARVEQLVRP